MRKQTKKKLFHIRFDKKAFLNIFLFKGGCISAEWKITIWHTVGTNIDHTHLGRTLRTYYLNVFWEEHWELTYILTVSGIYIIMYILCLSVCPFVSNKRQNGWTDWAQILCRASHDPGKKDSRSQSKVEIEEGAKSLVFI